MGARKKKERFQDPCSVPISIRKGRVVSLVVVPLGLVVNLDSKFCGHSKTYESNHFLEQRRRMMTTMSQASTSNKITKVKRSREVGFCIFFFGFCFVLGPFFFFMFFSNPKYFLSPRIWLLPTKLSTIEGFCHKERDFAMVLVFLSFYYSPKKIAKKNKEIEIKECIVGVNM